MRRYTVHLLILCCAGGLAQTQLNLARESKNSNFSQFPETRTLKTGTVLPSTCNQGDVFFNTAAPQGQNVYGCATLNTWSLEGGAGAGLTSQLLDFALSNTSSTVLTIGANCSASTPCNYTDNNVLALSLTAPCSVTLGGTNSSGTVYVYISQSGALTIGQNSAATLTPSGTCTVATGITSFPDGSMPIGIPTFTNNVWSSVTAAVDRRGFLNGNVMTPGTGIVTMLNGATGVKTVSTDSTVIPQYTTGSGAPSGNCVAGRDFYTDTANGNLWFCKTTNTWAQANGGGSVTNGVYVLASTHSNASTSLNGSTSGTRVSITGSTVTIPANALGANGCIRLTFTLKPGGSTAKDYDLNWGGTQVNFQFGQAATGTIQMAMAYVCNANNTASQNIQFNNYYWASVGSQGSANPEPTTVTSINTTASQTLKLTAAAQGATGGASDSVTLIDYMVEILPHS